MSILDNFVNECDIGLKTLSFKKSGTGRSYPSNQTPLNLSKDEKNLSAQLMRVNLAGEVAAQALYRGQAMVCKDAEIKAHLVQAGEEETDHLIWCKKRLAGLNGRPSLLNPVWYAGSFAIGAIFGSFGKKTSLGFVEETEKQVVKHLDGHKKNVSTNDNKAKAVMKQMREDEEAHGLAAREAGAADLPEEIKEVMSAVAKIMTSTSYQI